MGKVYFMYVTFHCLDHEWEIEGVVSPVVHSIMNEDLFVTFDVSGGT